MVAVGEGVTLLFKRQPTGLKCSGFAALRPFGMLLSAPDCGASNFRTCICYSKSVRGHLIYTYSWSVYIAFSNDDTALPSLTPPSQTSSTPTHLWLTCANLMMMPYIQRFYGHATYASEGALPPRRHTLPVQRLHILHRACGNRLLYLRSRPLAHRRARL